MATSSISNNILLICESDTATATGSQLSIQWLIYCVSSSIDGYTYLIGIVLLSDLRIT